MKTNSSVVTATLTLSALVMVVLLLATPSRPAQGSMMASEGGLTMMTSGLTQGSDENLIIIDKSTGRMLVYRLNQNNFELMGNADLNSVFEHTGTATR